MYYATRMMTYIHDTPPRTFFEHHGESKMFSFLYFQIYEDLYLLDRNKEEVIELYFYSAKKSANLHASIR
jgi:hypothetical protein